ncbi:MAG TPA: type II toxin-antitoxin system RelE/ParE family toxin [Vicinamibacterales bacterium]|nr:type II toxin-antitoxin system RelE/ParE family toxin [Vicinamibacterales bacterium]
MRSILWTEQAQADLAAIHTFISHDSVRYADVVVAELIAATDRLALFPESGRAVPEFKNSEVRETIRSPYRIVYRLVGNDYVHILTVHHAAREFPATL